MEVDLEGPGAFSVSVVGASHRQAALQAVAEREGGPGAIVKAVLVLEDDNPHDPNAVRVEIGGALCGYLSRDDAKTYRAHLVALAEPDLIVHCKAKIVGGFDTKDGGRAHLGLKLDLPPFT